jgi:hypothetical protein
MTLADYYGGGGGGYMVDSPGYGSQNSPGGAAKACHLIQTGDMN